MEDIETYLNYGTCFLSMPSIKLTHPSLKVMEMVFPLAPLSILGVEQTQLKSLVRLSFLNLMSILELSFPNTVF